MKPRYIAIDGPIGVGKTSLAGLLADGFEGRLMLEQVEDNPFLADFYKDRESYAFQTQIFFLFSRYRQQREAVQQELFKQTIVSDYTFDKDRVFASLNLSDDELALYDQIHALLDHRVARPDLVIYLQASVPTLMERVRRRGKDYERGIEADYLERLSKAYNDFFFYYDQTPLLVVNTDQIDFVESRADFEELVKEIRRLKRGTKYFVPLGSG